MKVLIISNNVLSNTDNMGKTLLAYFSNFNKDELAQLYIQKDFPTINDVCSTYYRVTDVDVLKSIYKFKTNSNIYNNVVYNNNDKSFKKAYEIGRKHGPISSFCRDLVWNLGHWFDKKLKTWLLNFNPDIIFFASGNSCFMYDVALKISKFLNIPIVNSIYDDYYLNNTNDSNLLARIYHKNLLKKADKVFNKSLFTLVVSDEMAKDYKKITNNQLNVMYTGTTFEYKESKQKDLCITYLGGVSLGRGEQLSKLGEILKNLDNSKNIHYIDVYTAEKNENLLELLTLENGIRLHKPVSSSEVDEILSKSLLTLHVESFDEPYKSRVKYSFSTKIPNIMAKSNCVLAFGPSDVASIGYLKRNDVAYVIDDMQDIDKKLVEIINNDTLRNEINLKAKEVAKLEHNAEVNSIQLRKWIETALNGGDINENTSN